MSYLALAYYRFTPLQDPHLEIQKHKKFFENKDVAGRIYISEEGINGQMSGSIQDTTVYQEWLRQDSRFADIEFKIHTYHENIFPRMTVKYRQQLAALDEKVDLADTGVHVSPEKWRHMLENEKDVLLLDVRNNYETAVGHFENAHLPPLDKFRDFPAYVDELKQTIDPKTKVMMYCTGGIRCELFSALMKKKGFSDVYQLDGGIINYGLQEGTDHWKGKLFVFDDRLACNIDGKEAGPISKCHHCHLPSDTYYNCANMDCNELFLCCKSCHETYQGACSHTCKQSPRMRPYNPKDGNKPFRRKHLLEQESK